MAAPKHTRAANIAARPLRTTRSVQGALRRVAVLTCLLAACRSNSADRGLSTGLACERDSDCASNFCLETRADSELVCCIRRCDDGAVCKQDGVGCEFAPLPSLGPDDVTSQLPVTPNPGTPDMAVSGAGSGAAVAGSADAMSSAAPDATIAATSSAATDTSSASDDGSFGAEAGAPTSVDVPSSGDASIAEPASEGTTALPPAADAADASSVPTTLLDAGSALQSVPTTPDTPPAGCDTELLANGDFEAGATVWVTASTWGGAHAIVSAQDSGLQQEGVTPQAGEFLAWLGGIPDNDFDSHEVSMEQPFNVPEDVSRLGLKGYVRIASLEPEQDAPYDSVFIDVLGAGEKVIWIPHIWSNLDAMGAWVAFNYELTGEQLDAMRGKTLLLRLHSETDPEKKTSFWFDSLSMIATCGR